MRRCAEIERGLRCKLFAGHPGACCFVGCGPEWTTTRPTEPGWYWRHLLGWSIGVVEIFGDRRDDCYLGGSVWWPVRIEPPPVKT